MRRACAIIGVLVALLLGGCGGASSGSRSPTAEAAVPHSATDEGTTTSATEASEPTKSVMSFSDTVPVAMGGYHFTVSVKLTLGTASTNTEGQEPPNMNVVARVSGSGEIANHTSGYTASIPGQLPRIGIFALYPASGVLCRNQQPLPGAQSVSTTVSTDAGVCAIGVAEAAVPCIGNADSEPPNVPAATSLAPGESTTLALWPVVSGNASYTSGYPLSLMSPTARCEDSYEEKPSESFGLGGIPSTEASTFVNALNEPPRYWTITTESPPASKPKNLAIAKRFSSRPSLAPSRQARRGASSKPQNRRVPHTPTSLR